MLQLVPLPYRIAASATVLLGVLSLGVWAGWSIRDQVAQLADAERSAAEAKQGEEEKGQLAEALMLERRSAEQMQTRVAAVDLAAAVQQEKIRTVYRTINKEVIRYVQNQDIERCALSADWRVLHDAAAVGELPEAAFADGLFAGGAGEVDDAAALATVAGNYEQCNRWREQVAGWQEWHRAVTAPADAQ